MGVKVGERTDKPGWWVFINYHGRRTKKCFGSGKAAEKAARSFAEKLSAQLKWADISGEALPQTSRHQGVMFEAYAATWLERIQHTRKYSTAHGYEKMLTRYLLPVFQGLALSAITRDKIKGFATAKLKEGHAPKTAQNIIRGLSSILSHAVEDGLIPANPALKPGKFLPSISRRRSINPLTREEVEALLAAVDKHCPSYATFFLCAVRTGLRLGELLALDWGDIDYHGNFIEVQRNYVLRRICTPKSGESRRVDMSDELAQALKDLHAMRQAEAAVNGWEAVPSWVFCQSNGRRLDPDNFRKKVFRKLLTAAGLRTVRIHDLRHTFASLLLQQGESPVYVMGQMGHSSIQVTVDIYGHLIPGGNRQAVNRLDRRPEEYAINTVSVGQSSPQPHPELADQ